MTMIQLFSQSSYNYVGVFKLSSQIIPAWQMDYPPHVQAVHSRPSPSEKALQPKAKKGHLLCPISASTVTKILKAMVLA